MEFLYILYVISQCLDYAWAYSSEKFGFESVCGVSTYDVILPYYDIGTLSNNTLDELQCARQCIRWTENFSDTSICVGLNICHASKGSVCELLLRESVFDIATCSSMNTISGCTFYHLRSEVWPRGVYTLTTPSLNCPKDWYPTSINLAMETGGNTNYSAGNHIQQNQKANSTNDVVELPTCTKMSEFGTYDWPAGDYCILSTKCPSDFQTGYIVLDEEDDISDQDLNFSFCCRNDGLSSVPIQLPTASPFYLFRFVGDCQEVIGMTVSEEYIHFDTEDSFNIDEFHGSHALVFPVGTAYLDMRFCYYE